MILGTVIGLGLNLASSISEKKRKKKELKNNLNAVATDKEELEKWYQKASNSDYIDSSATKNSVIALSEEKKKHDEILGNNAVRTGATPEAQIAQAAASNKAYSDAVYRLASLGNNQKSKTDSIYFQNKKELNARENALRNTNTSSHIDYSKLLNSMN